MMEKAVFVKASVERKPEFRQLTMILEKGNKRIVRKVPVGEAAREHMQDYLRNYALLKDAMKHALEKEDGVDLIPCTETEDGSVEFPYLSDLTLMDCLKGKDPEMYRNKIIAFREALIQCFGTVPFQKSEAFYEVFGNLTPADGTDALSVTIADLIFDNVFCPDDHRYILIDYEWIFPFSLPLSYLLYRALMLDPTFSSYSEEERQIVLNGIGVNKEDEVLFKQMELAFLNYVSPDIYKLDYFARVPDARKTVLHDFEHLLTLPDALGKEIEESKKRIEEITELREEITQHNKAITQLHEEKTQLNNAVAQLNEEKTFYTSKLWFKVFNKLGVLKTKGKRKIKNVLKSNILISKCFKCVRYMSKYGPSRTTEKVKNYLDAKSLENSYTEMMISEMNAIKGKKAEHIHCSIKFSVLVPLYNTPEPFLKEMIQSVQDQTYSNWELCLADGSDETHSEVEGICRDLAEKDSRILYRKLEHNGGISENTNACLDMATGEYIVLFDHDDLLHPSALYENAKVIRDQKADFIYSDEVVFNSPNLENWLATHFKPDYSPENLLSNNYICHLSVFKTSLLKIAGRFRKEFDGSQDHDIILRLTDCAQRVVHIPKVLYFWRSHPTSTASDIGSKTYAITAGQNAVKDYLRVSRGIETRVESTPEYPTMYHVLFPIAGTPEVDILLDAAGYGMQDIRQKIQYLRQKTQWKNVHITVITGDDTATELAEDFSLVSTPEKSRTKRLNMAAMNSKSDYLLFLSMELDPLGKEWMDELLMYAQQKAIGAVGGRAYFADNTLRHGGLIIGLGEMRLVGRSHFRIDRGNGGYFGQIAIVEDVSAVSAECMMISREKFIQTGGFDSEFVDTLFDVDLCLKLLKDGYRNVYTPFADFTGGKPEAFSIDYGSESSCYKNDSATLRKKQFEAIKKADPYYNLNLTLDVSDYRLSYPPRN